MTRQKLTVGAVAAAFMLSIAPAWAQEGARPNSSGSSSGSAAPRGGEGGSSSSSSSGSSSSGGSMSSPSGGGFGSSGTSTMGTGGYAGARERAPERPSAYGRSTGRDGGSSSGGDRGDRAMARPSGGDSRDAFGTPGTASSRGEYMAPGRDREPVPAYSRPRGNRPVVGVATERAAGDGVLPPNGRPGSSYYPLYDSYYYWGYYDPYYYYWRTRYWLPGYGYGFGYFGYDPYLFGGYGGYYDPYFSEGQSSGSYGYSQYKGVGSIRLKVKPANAQVYVDGYFVGEVDSFDGTFQKLSIEGGSHRVEVRAEGYEPFQFEVMVVPGETITYKGELKRIQ